MERVLVVPSLYREFRNRKSESDCLVRHTTCYVVLARLASGVPEFAVTAGTIL